MMQVRLTAALASAPEADFRPQQVFMRLTSRDTEAAAYFAAVKANDGTLYATAKSADVQKQVLAVDQGCRLLLSREPPGCCSAWHDADADTSADSSLPPPAPACTADRAAGGRV